MLRVEASSFYHEAFQELNYSFGDFYLFEHFVIAEISDDIVFNWREHAKILVEDLTNLYGENSRNIIYISNRVNNYSVVPSDWVHFFRYSYSLKGYYIVSKHGKTMQNTLLEKLFFKGKMQTFDDLKSAVKEAKKTCIPQDKLLRVVV